MKTLWKRTKVTSTQVGSDDEGEDVNKPSILCSSSLNLEFEDYLLC
jgi:hypothetical protein